MSPLFLFTLLIPEIIVHDVSFAFIRVKQVKYSFFKGRLRVGGENPLFANSVRVFEHVSTTKTTHSTSILRSSFAASAFTDAFFVYHSRISCGCFFQKKYFY